MEFNINESHDLAAQWTIYMIAIYQLILGLMVYLKHTILLKFLCLEAAYTCLSVNRL